MPNWVSKDGEWFPAKEKVALKKESGEPFIYEGPDRAAIKELWEQAGRPKVSNEKDLTDKKAFLGQDFRSNTDMINTARQLGYKTVDAYVKAHGYSADEAKKNFEEKASEVSVHELPKKVDPAYIEGGGMDTSGQGNDKMGGFKRPKEL